MTQASLCKDCKWAKPFRVFYFSHPDWFRATCHAPQNHKLSLVTGEREWPLEYKYCDVHRAHPANSKTCGQDPQWFQPKASA